MLGLYGFGVSAHVVIQLTIHEGMRVLVFTRSQEHQRLAGRLGAEWAGQAGEAAPAELDGGVMFAPAGSLIPEALKALRRGGTLALAGSHMTPIP